MIVSLSSECITHAIAASFTKSAISNVPFLPDFWEKNNLILLLKHPLKNLTGPMIKEGLVKHQSQARRPLH